MKVSDIETVLPPVHSVSIEAPHVEDESRDLYSRNALYIGKVSNIPDNLKSADVVNIMANDLFQIIIRVDERSVS